jgi:hypothetical protein
MVLTLPIRMSGRLIDMAATTKQTIAQTAHSRFAAGYFTANGPIGKLSGSARTPITSLE